MLKSFSLFHLLFLFIPLVVALDQSLKCSGKRQAQCSTVNVAYSTLRCPFRRAKYMLRRMGVDFEDGTSNTDPEFMMEVLEASSKIEDASRDRERPLGPLRC
jgi:DnaJ-domain-containing protein 1